MADRICEECGGSGVLYSETCVCCGGKGYVRDDGTYIEDEM